MKISSITRRNMLVQSAAGALAFAGCRRFSAGDPGSGGNGHTRASALFTSHPKKARTFACRASSTD